MKKIKKILSLSLAIILTLSLSACGSNSPESSVEPQTEVVSQDNNDAQSDVVPDSSEDTSEESSEPAAEIIAAGEEGAGPGTVVSKYATLEIPEGMEYEVEYSNATEGENGSFQLSINKAGKHDLESFEISTTRMISSIEDAVDECVRMNKFSDDAEITYGDDVTYGGVTYKSVHIVTASGKPSDFLVTYFVNFEGFNTYVEMKTTENPFGGVDMPIDDPMVVSLLENIQYNK